MVDLLILIVLVILVPPIVALLQIHQLKRRVDTISAQNKELSQRLDQFSQTASSAQVDSQAVKAPPQLQTPPRAEQHAAQSAALNASSVDVKAEPAKPRPDEMVKSEPAKPVKVERKPPVAHKPYPTPEWQLKLKQHFKDNWLVWCGGLALVFGLGYLVQFIAHRIEITPATRVGMALLVSLLTVGVGEWLHRKFHDAQVLAGKDYIPAAIVAAGTTGVYATLVFATVSYHLLAPTLALVLIAATALVSLFAAVRYGSLMAVLGLIGGYIAPLWLTFATPAYFVLGCYISAVSAVGIYVLKRCQLPWLLWGVFAGHMLWLATISFFVPEPLWWVAIFYPITAYLLSTVPAQGWTLRSSAIPCPDFEPYFAPLLLSFSLLIGLDKHILPATLSASVLVVAILAMLLWQPILLKQRHPYHAPVLAAWLTAVFVTSLYSQQPQTMPFMMLVAIVAVWWLLSIAQAYQGFLSHSNKVNYWWLIAGPQALVLSLLFYTDIQLHDSLWISSLFSVVVMALLALLAFKVSRLRSDLSVVIHVFLLANIFLWTSGPTFGLLLSLQVALVVWQMVKQQPPMHSLVVKGLVSLLLLRLSVLPLVPEWFSSAWPTWTLGFVNFMPPIVVLIWAMRLTKNQPQIKGAKSVLADWLEGALVHISALLLLVESHYLVTGTFQVFSHVDLISASFWLIEALTLCAVYGYRQQHCEHVLMQKIYLTYRQGLLVFALLCTLLINLEYMPLWSDSVTGEALPVFNLMALGWLIPGALLGLVTWREWLPATEIFNREQSKLAGYSIAGGLVGIWLLLSIRQFWQPGTLDLKVGTTMAEWLSYSVTLIIAGCVLTFIGIRKANLMIQKVGLSLLGVASLKVFLSDIGHLDGAWRVVSFLGLGVALIGIGRLFQVLKTKQPITPQQ